MTLSDYQVYFFKLYLDKNLKYFNQMDKCEGIKIILTVINKFLFFKSFI